MSFRTPKALNGHVVAGAHLQNGSGHNPGVAYDRELFRRESLPRVTTVKLSEISEAAGCSEGVRVRHTERQRTPHLSTWQALAQLADARSRD